MRFGEFYRPHCELTLYLRRNSYLDAVTEITNGEIVDDLAATVYPAYTAEDGPDCLVCALAWPDHPALTAWRARWELPDPWGREAALNTIYKAARFLDSGRRYIAWSGMGNPRDLDAPSKARAAIGTVWPGLTAFDDWGDEIGMNAWHPSMGTETPDHFRGADFAATGEHYTPLNLEIGEVYGAFRLPLFDEAGAPITVIDSWERWMALAQTRIEIKQYMEWKLRLSYWKHLNPEADERALPSEAELTAMTIPPYIGSQFEEALREYLDGVEARAILAGWKRTRARRAAGGGRQGESQGPVRTTDPFRHYRWLAEWQVLGLSDAKIAQLERLSTKNGSDTIKKARTQLAKAIGLSPRRKKRGK